MATEPLPEYYVLFLDLLGFSSLVEAAPLGLDGYYVPEGSTYRAAAASTIFHRFQDVLSSISTYSTLTVRFTHLLFFSDCAFLVFNDPLAAAEHAQVIQHDNVAFDVPVRMGIAKGTVISRGFAFTSGASRPTVQEQLISKAVFYGTGVVRAHAAERSRKGFRILLHSSLSKDDLARISTKLPILPLSDADKRARHELNYLGNYLKPPRGQDGYIWNSFRIMRDSLSIPVSRKVWKHFEESYAAWNRMRVQHGDKPFDWTLDEPPLTDDDE